MSTKITILIAGMIFILIVGSLATPFLLPVYYTGQVVILTYHRVSNCMETPWDSQQTVTPVQFRQHLQYFKDHGFHVLSLDEALKILENKQQAIPDKALVITFDDGDVSYQENAVPILTSFNYPSTEFIIGKFSFDNRRGYMSWPQITQLAGNKLINIHSHTYNAHSNSRINGHVNYATDPLYLEKEKRMESGQEYAHRINRDCAQEQKLFMKYLKRGDNIIALPYGHGTPEYIRLAQNSGYKYFLTEDEEMANTHLFNAAHIYRLDVGNIGTDSSKLSLLIKGQTSSGPSHLLYLAKLQLSFLFHYVFAK